MRRVALLLYVLAAGCHRGGGSATDDQEMATPEQHPDEHAAMAADHAMAGMVSNEDLHMRLTPLRPPAPGDSARAAEVLAGMRRELAKYRDIRRGSGRLSQLHPGGRCADTALHQDPLGIPGAERTRSRPAHVTALPARGGRRSHPGRCDVHRARADERDRARRTAAAEHRALARAHQLVLAAAGGCPAALAGDEKRSAGLRSDVTDCNGGSV